MMGVVPQDSQQVVLGRSTSTSASSSSTDYLNNKNATASCSKIEKQHEGLDYGLPLGLVRKELEDKPGTFFGAWFQRLWRILKIPSFMLLVAQGVPYDSLFALSQSDRGGIITSLITQQEGDQSDC